MKSSQHLLRALLAIPLCAVTASAANFYWNGAADTKLGIGSRTNYSTDPDAVIVPLANPTAADDVVFNMNTRSSQNSIGSLGAVNISLNSVLFASSGTTQIDRATADSTSANNLILGTSLTMQAGAGAVTFGSNQQRAQLRAGGAALAINNNSSSALTFNRNVGSTAASGTSTITVGGSGSGTITFEEQIINNATPGGAIVALTIDRSGSGLVSLNSASASNYSGGFTLMQGNVSANAATALGTSQVNINGGALALFGAGTGVINLGAGANFNLSGGTVTFDLGSSFDQIIGTGALNLTGGTLALNVGGAGFSYVSTYQLFSGFSGNSVTGLAITGYDSVNYFASLGDNGLLSFSAVPEPSSYAALAGFAALGLVALRRRRVTR